MKMRNQGNCDGDLRTSLVQVRKPQKINLIEYLIYFNVLTIRVKLQNIIRNKYVENQVHRKNKLILEKICKKGKVIIICSSMNNSFTCHYPVCLIPALRRLTQENYKFKTRIGYITKLPATKKKWLTFNLIISMCILF